MRREHLRVAVATADRRGLERFAQTLNPELSSRFSLDLVSADQRPVDQVMKLFRAHRISLIHKISGVEKTRSLFKVTKIISDLPEK